MQELAPTRELLAKLARTKMPFGRYKDRFLADLPEHYVMWFARAGFPEGELGQMLALLYEIQLNGLEHLLDPLGKTIDPARRLLRAPENL